MSIQEKTNGGPEAISPERVPSIQQSCTGISMHALANCTSTGRQTNLQAVVGALGVVERLHGVSFNGKSDGKHEIGLTREEMAEVLPEAIAYDGRRQEGRA